LGEGNTDTGRSTISSHSLGSALPAPQGYGGESVTHALVHIAAFFLPMLRCADFQRTRSTRSFLQDIR
jgi:hypothetical protein